MPAGHSIRVVTFMAASSYCRQHGPACDESEVQSKVGYLQRMTFRGNRYHNFDGKNIPASTVA